MNLVVIESPLFMGGFAYSDYATMVQDMGPSRNGPKMPEEIAGILEVFEPTSQRAQTWFAEPKGGEDVSIKQSSKGPQACSEHFEHVPRGDKGRERNLQDIMDAFRNPENSGLVNKILRWLKL